MYKDDYDGYDNWSEYEEDDVEFDNAFSLFIAENEDIDLFNYWLDYCNSELNDSEKFDLLFEDYSDEDLNDIERRTYINDFHALVNELDVMQLIRDQLSEDGYFRQVVIDWYNDFYKSELSDGGYNEDRY